MRMFIIFITLALLVLCSIYVCTRKPVAALPDPEAAIRADYQTLLACVRRSRSVILYEGLPHQTWEGDVLGTELAAKQTVQLYDFPFYAEKIGVDHDDVDDLAELLLDPGTLDLREDGVLIMKMCGGFHPDWCIEWRDGDLVCRFLVCLGCAEIKAYSGKMTIHGDCDSSVKRFKAILNPYQKNRPAKAKPVAAQASNP